MRLSVQEIVNLFSRMQNGAVVLYGAGKRGQFAFDVLTQEGINITAVADRAVGKKLGGIPPYRWMISVQEQKMKSALLHL